MGIDSERLELSAQRALFDRIKSNVRLISIGVVDGTTITLFFYYDGEPSEEDEELAGDAGAEVIASFPQYFIDWKLIRVDYPTPIVPAGDYIVYARYEK